MSQNTVCESHHHALLLFTSLLYDWVRWVRIETVDYLKSLIHEEIGATIFSKYIIHAFVADPIDFDRLFIIWQRFTFCNFDHYVASGHISKVNDSKILIMFGNLTNRDLLIAIVCSLTGIEIEHSSAWKSQNMHFRNHLHGAQVNDWSLS